MGSNLGEFLGEIRDFIEIDIPEAAVASHEEVTLDAHRRVVERTPRDKGTTQQSWYVSVGQPSRATQDMGSVQATLDQGRSALVALQPYQVSFVTNNQPNILVLEDGGFVPADPGPSKDPRPDRKGRVLVRKGFSVQAPQGMVKVTIPELVAEFG